MTGVLDKSFIKKDFHFLQFDTKSLKNEQLYGISHSKSVTDLKKDVVLHLSTSGHDKMFLSIFKMEEKRF